MALAIKKGRLYGNVATGSFKSNRYGINLILDADMPFGQLEEAISEKFRESEKFLKTRRSQFLLRGAGSHQEEEFSILDMIAKNTSITGHLCSVDQDEMPGADVQGKD